MSQEEAKKEAGKLGGLKRAEALSDEQKKEIAQKAALARWGAKATHRGNFVEQFGIDVDCYVLDDPGKTAVISQRGMAAALGLGGGSGKALPRFVSSKNIAPYVGVELKEKFENPLIFQMSSVVSNTPGTRPGVKLYGYDVTILIDLCKAILSAEADGKLRSTQVNVVRSAHVIVNASAKLGIKGLVYALAGYNPTADEVIKAFKLYVQEEAREYEREFPPQLYSEWYRLYQLPKPERGRPWKAKSLTVDHVYYPLARSNGKVLKLTREQRANSGNRGDKLHQFLSEIGVKALRTHLGQVLGIARISKTEREYEKHINTLFGVQPDLPGIE
jgi:hypothetical protein